MTRPEDLELEGEMNIFQRPRTALIPMFTASFSAFGSYLVIRELWGDRHSSSSSSSLAAPRSSMRPPLVRALLGFCVVDIIGSVAYGLSTIPTPHWQTHVPYALGNYETCEAQGFSIQFANVAGPLYNTLLTFFYLVIIKYQWTDVHIRRMEGWTHSLIWIVSLACSVIFIPMELYNNPYHGCWISSYPEGCELLKPEVPCERGGDWIFWFSLFTVFPLWPSLMAVSIMMCMVYSEVRKVEAAAAKKPWGYTKSSVIHEESKIEDFRNETSSTQRSTGLDDTINQQQEEEGEGSNSQQVSRSRSRAVARQALLFVLAFVATHALRLFIVLWFAIANEGHLILYVIAMDVMLPMQGVFNAIVLLRTRKLQTREGKFVQWAFNGLCSGVGSIWQRLNVLCCCCWRRPHSSHSEIVEEEDIPPTSNTEEKSMPLEDHTTSRDVGMHASADSITAYGAQESGLFNESNLQNLSSVGPDDSMAEVERAIAAMLGGSPDSESGGPSAAEDKSASAQLTDTSLDAGMHKSADSATVYGAQESGLFNESNLQNVSSMGPDDSMAEVERAIAAMLDSSPESESNRSRR